MHLRSLPALILLLALSILFLSSAAPSGAQGDNAPEKTPDAGPGLLIYQERCADCHGPAGSGDGELAAQLPAPPTALGSERFLRRAVPARMFELITSGIPAAGMPPFGPTSSNPLAEASRWDVIAAVYRLGTTPETLEQGQELFAAACADCHEGEADGVLGDIAYWSAHSNLDLFNTFSSESAIEGHQAVTLSEDELWTAIAYARTFSYDSTDVHELLGPIESALVTGVVVNETTGAALSPGTEVVLSGFTRDFQPAIVMTTTLDAEASFSFEVTDVPPDLVYMATVDYEGISFGSELRELERADPALALPVAVYEQTTDAASVTITELHVILEFAEEAVIVNELYQFSQDAPAVFVGPTGDPSAGTISIVLPQGASSPVFQRTFGDMSQFFPVETIIQTERGWADTVPLRPGAGTLNLLVRYTLPYESGMEVSHPVQYDVERASLVIADAGVTLAEQAPWTQQETGAMGGLFPSYVQQGIPAEAPVSFRVEGEPRPVTGPQDSAGQPTVPAAAVERNETSELLIGGGALLLAVATTLYLVRLWQQNPAPAAETAETVMVDEEREESGGAFGSALSTEREALLLAIARLDDAYEAGELEQPAYQARRRQLKEQLLLVWDETSGEGA
ncbi:MAG: cytochrome c [Candidatus Promineifilaceae bacterium]|nr:cytochrome c [Candidatus Promineifilaceae bacterium]